MEFWPLHYFFSFQTTPLDGILLLSITYKPFLPCTCTLYVGN